MTKIIIVGDQCTGKTYMCKNLINQYYNGYTSSDWIELYTYKSVKNQNNIYIWNFSGNKSHLAMQKNYYKDATLCIIFGDDKLWRNYIKTIVPYVEIVNYVNPHEFYKIIKNL